MLHAQTGYLVGSHALLVACRLITVDLQDKSHVNNFVCAL